MQEVSGGVAPTHNHMHMPVHAIVSRNDVTCLYKIKNVNLHQEFSWAYVPKTRPSISHISLNSWWWWFWYMLMHNKQGWRCIYIYSYVYWHLKRKINTMIMMMNMNINMNMMLMTMKVTVLKVRVLGSLVPARVSGSWHQYLGFKIFHTRQHPSFSHHVHRDLKQQERTN